MDIALLVAIIAMLPGVAGVFLPLIPAVPYMFVVAVIYAVGTGNVTGSQVGWLALIAGLSLAADWGTGVLAARFGGAKKQALLLGLLGAVVGSLLIPPFGGLIGVFAGVLYGEYIVAGGDFRKALRAALAGAAGSAVGMLISLVLAVTFLITFVAFAI